MALNWFSQIFPCLSVRRVHESTDVPDVVTETRTASGRQFSGERARPSLESLPLEVPPPRGHDETLSWLDNGNATGVIAARDAADRSIRDCISSNASDISYAAEETVIIQRDFSRDENGLDLFAVGTPGTGPFTPTLPSAPPTNEAPGKRRGSFPREPSSVDITRFDRSPPSSSVSTPGCRSQPDDWKHLDLPHAGTVWPFGVDYESFSERINALSLAVSEKNRVAEEDSSWKRGSVKSRRPVLHVNTQFEAPVAQPRAALVGSPSEYGNQTTDLPEMPTTVPPSDQGRHEGESPEVPNVHSLAAELSDLDDDSSSSSPDDPVESPTALVNGFGIGSTTSDSDSRQDVHPESPTIESPTIKSPAIKSPTIDKLADNDNINPDVPADSPTGVSESSSIEELINDINGYLDGIAESTAHIVGAPKVDKPATDSDSNIEARPEPSPSIPDGKCGLPEMKQAKKEYWDVASDDASLDFESDPPLFVG
ncbi:hypothetical protein CEP54_010692 [Fusarium duplospermum]|uniref:Uncharacterized protein n=1 Tax=Fusarium duplospermum TaxID=1325734 RepID=A0A428PID7_9HYPO|nr:hypothetical protein CEP54_010692 [Fusarium duplospermum]